MDEPGLIGAYLTELRRSVERLPDADDIVVETADHLYTTVDELRRSGLDQAEAEAKALARFGSVQLVAKVFAEEAKRGGAVSTTLTRRAGLAAMVTVPLLVVGGAGNALTDRGGLHAGFVGMLTAAVFTFCYALWGIRRRHGGLGASGRVAFWLFVAAPALSIPFGWVAHVAWVAQMLVILGVLGVAMLDARLLPPLPVALVAFTPLVALAVSGAVAGVADYAGPWLLVSLAPVGTGILWIGWAMSREPALDVKSLGQRASAAP